MPGSGGSAPAASFDEVRRLPALAPGSRDDSDMVTAYAPGTPNWVDLGTTDVSAAEDFYGSLFGWTVQDLGPDSGGYSMLLKDGRQIGGIGPATDPSRGSSWSVYFATSNADAAATAVTENGGSIALAPMDVMDQGRMAVFADPSGAYFSVWQPGEHAGAELLDAPGALSWAELSTDDLGSAKSFYHNVLQVSTRDVEMAPGMSYTLLSAADHAVAGAMPIGGHAGRVTALVGVLRGGGLRRRRRPRDRVGRPADPARRLAGRAAGVPQRPAGRAVLHHQARP